MKTSLASAISVFGVLTAGAAAFAVNTAVLQPSPQPVVAATDAPVTSTTAGVVERQSAAPSSTTPVTPVVPVAQQQPSQTSTYKVGDAGRVILEVEDGRLSVASVLPSNGWTAKAPEYEDGEVEVTFRSGSLEVEFKARLNSGDIQVFVESEDESNDDAYEREYHDDDDHEDEDDD